MPARRKRKTNQLADDLGLQNGILEERNALLTARLAEIATERRGAPPPNEALFFELGQARKEARAANVKLTRLRTQVRELVQLQRRAHRAELEYAAYRDRLVLVEELVEETVE